MKKIYRSDLMKKLGNFKKVENLYSPRTGNPVPNQFELTFENGYVFQSYDSLIAVNIGGQVYLSSLHDYSKTTSKYCNEWVGCNTAQRRELLMEGDYILIVEDYK